MSSPYFAPPTPPRPPAPGGQPRRRTLAIALGAGLALAALAGVAGALIYTGALGRRPPEDDAAHAAPKPIEKDPKPKPRPSKRADALPILETDPIRGADDALVTLVEFGDLDDPLTVAQEKTVTSLLAKYDKKLRLVWKDFPIAWHKESRRAAELARLGQIDAGPARFWAIHDDALARKSKVTTTLEAWEKKLGPELRERAGADAKQRIDESIALAKTLKVTLAPAFFLDGELVRGGRGTLEKALEKAIDAHLLEAEKLLADGTPRGDLYATMVERHFAEAPPLGVGALVGLELTGGTELAAAAAPATVVVFGDLDAPAIGVRPSLVELAKSPDVRLVWRDRPTTPDGRAAALVLRAIGARLGAAKQLEAIDALWTLRSGGAPPALDLARLAGVAKGVGLSDADVERALKDAKALAAIEDDLGEAEAVDLGAPTNAFFVNGRRLTGGTRHDVEAAVTWGVALGKKRLAAGVAPKDLYADLTSGASRRSKRKATLTAPPGAHSKGASAGPGVVTVQLFFDLECPKSRQLLAAGGPLEAFLRAHGGEVRVVFRHQPASYRKNAEPAAQLALEAAAEKGQAGYFRAIEAIYRPTRLDPKALDAVVAAEGLDAARVGIAMTTHKYKAIIDADLRAARGAGLYQTPTLVFGDEIVGSGGATLVGLEAALGRAKRRAAP